MLVYQRVTDLNPLRQRPCISDPVSFDAHGLLRAQFPCRIFPLSRDDATGRPTPQDNLIGSLKMLIAEFQGNQRDCWDGLVCEELMMSWDFGEHVPSWHQSTEYWKLSNLKCVSSNWCIWSINIEICFFYHKISLLIWQQIRSDFPYHPCMVYLPTFTIKINQM